MSWYGPYKVLERRNKVDYLVDEPRGPKLYHANILKRYFRRAQVNAAYIVDEVSAPSSDETSLEVPAETDDVEDLLSCPSVLPT